MGWLSSNWWLSPNCWLSSSWWLSSSNQYTSIGDYLSLPLCQLSRTGWTAECAFALFHLPLKYHLKLFCQEQAKTTGCFSSIGKPLFPFAVNFFFSPVLVGCRMVIALFWGPPVCVAGVDAFWDWEWRNWSILVTQWGSRQSSCLPLQWPKDRKNWTILLRRSSWPGEWFFFLKRSLSAERALTEKASLIPWGCNCGVREYLWIILPQYFAEDHITGTTTNSLNALKFTWWQQSATAQDFKDRAVVEEDCLSYENVWWQCLTARIIRKMERGSWIIHNYPSIHNCQLLGCSRPGRGQGKGCLTNRATYWKLPGVQEDEAWAKASQDQAAA